MVAAAMQPLFGEHSRKLDDRYRLTLPNEFEELFKPDEGKCVLAKEQSGCLSLWDADLWKTQMDGRVDLISQRFKLGDLASKTADLQRLGRLISTRHREIQLAGRSRLLLPEGFREFLGIEPGQDVMVVGAFCCINLWHPQKWIDYTAQELPQYGGLLDQLSH